MVQRTNDAKRAYAAKPPAAIAEKVQNVLDIMDKAVEDLQDYVDISAEFNTEEEASLFQKWTRALCAHGLLVTPHSCMKYMGARTVIVCIRWGARSLADTIADVGEEIAAGCSGISGSVDYVKNAVESLKSN